LILPAGKLDKRVSLQTATNAQDASGNFSQTWSTTATIWAAIEPLNAREIEQAKTFSDAVSHKVTIRHRSTPPTAKQRILYGSRVLLINGVVNTQEAGVETVLYCTEFVA
jgi:SPP1 family predicted phage head-tail adaptor